MTPGILPGVVLKRVASGATVTREGAGAPEPFLRRRRAEVRPDVEELIAAEAVMDTIQIEELEVFYHVGVGEEERSRPQRLLLSVQLVLDFSTAAAKDDVRWSIDYAAVCDRLASFGERRSWCLIETLAAEMADLLQREFGAPAVAVEVKKFAVPHTRWVSVRVSRPG